MTKKLYYLSYGLIPSFIIRQDFVRFIEQFSACYAFKYLPQNHNLHQFLRLGSPSSQIMVKLVYPIARSVDGTVAKLNSVNV